MFSRLNRIKMNYDNHLGQERLKHLLRIGEEGWRLKSLMQMSLWAFGTIERLGE